jgi:uncharacterized protein
VEGRRGSHVLVLAVLVGLSGCRAPERFIGFGGGPPGGAFFPAAAAIATFMEPRLPGVRVSVEASGGSSENMRLVHTGETHMAIAYGADIDAGYYGREDFRDAPQTDVRAVGLVFWSYGHVVALAQSGIRSVADLEGRRVAIGGAGTGSALAAERYFGHLRLLDRLRVSYLGGTAASSALKDGQVDAYHWQSAAPNSAVLDTVATHQVVLLDLAASAVTSGFLDAYPYYTVGEIPAGTYSGIDEPVPTLLMGAYWIVHKDLPEELVYEMVRTAYSADGSAYLPQVFQPLNDMTPEQALRGLTVPLHPGAERYWERAR